MTPGPLAIDLCVRPGPSAATWRRALQDVWDWQPRLRPVLARPLVPAEGDDPRPWVEQDLERLADLLAGTDEGSWQLTSGEHGSIYALRGRVQCRLTLTFGVAQERASTALAEAVSVTHSTVAPALGMAFDPASDDSELVMDGLHALRRLAPAVFLDAEAVRRLGGEEWVMSAPCPVREEPGGLLLDIRPLGCHDRSDPCMAGARRVADHLGVSAATPVTLL